MEGDTIVFFYGAAIAGCKYCGAGGTIINKDKSEIRWLINCGGGTNTKV